MEKFYRAAGTVFKMDSFGRTLRQAKPYEIESPAKVDFEVEPIWEKEKKNYPDVSDDNGEYMYSGAVFYKHLLDFDGLCLHSSAVVVDDRAYLFTAKSGTGKSTHTQLWLQLFGRRAYILNDDKPALRLENGSWYAYGTPWSGKYDLSINARVPLAGIAVLERSEENSIDRIDGIEAISSIIVQLNRVRSKDYRQKQIYLLGKLFESVPIWKLSCNMDISAARLSFEAMSGEHMEE